MEAVNYYIKVGQIIKELRQKKNMTRKQLADGICDVSYITRIENGYRCPTSVILRQLITKLGVSYEYLFRAIESESSIDAYELIQQLFLNIERHNFKNIYDLITNEEEQLSIKSVHDIQLINSLKCVSEAISNKNYQSGMNEIRNALNLTYTEGHNPTDIEFAIMFMYGSLFLLNNQNEEAYTYLTNIKKYVNTIKFFHTHEIIPRFYVYLISACLNISHLDESSSYIDFAINYCKKYNIHTVLRELYYLKSELYYRLDKEEEFKLWYDKAFTLHELIKESDDEFFEAFVKNRLMQIKPS